MTEEQINKMGEVGKGEAGKGEGGKGEAAWNLGLGLATLAVWAVVITTLLVSGKYQLYLIPQLWPLLVMGVVILVTAFIARVTLRGVHSHGPALNRNSLLVRTGLLVLPLLYLASVHGESLGSHAFNKRQVLGLPDPTRLSTLDIPAEDESGVIHVELPQLLWNYMRLTGCRVKTLGQVARDDTLPEGHILLFRFLINCCVADAQPAAVVVRIEGRPLPEADTWLCVTGPFEVGKVGERSALVIQAEEAEPVDAPSIIYLQ
jgi:putative membrane protein